LAQVVGRHAPAAGREPLEDALGRVVVADERNAHDRGDGIAGDVVLRRAQATAHDHRVGPRERQLEGGHDPLEVVAHHLPVRAVDAGERELLTQPGRVGVDDLAEQ
jgi:hypothetical protein